MVILQGDLQFSLAQNIHLDLFDIFSRFQMAIMDFEFYTGEKCSFSIETYS